MILGADEARIESDRPINAPVLFNVSLSKILRFGLSALRTTPRRSSTPSALDLSIITRLPNSLAGFEFTASSVSLPATLGFRKTSREIELVSVESLEMLDMRSSNSVGGAMRDDLLSAGGYFTKAEECDRGYRVSRVCWSLGLPVID